MDDRAPACGPAWWTDRRRSWTDGPEPWSGPWANGGQLSRRRRGGTRHGSIVHVEGPVAHRGTRDSSTSERRYPPISGRLSTARRSDRLRVVSAPPPPPPPDAPCPPPGRYDDGSRRCAASGIVWGVQSTACPRAGQFVDGPAGRPLSRPPRGQLPLGSRLQPLSRPPGGQLPRGPRPRATAARATRRRSARGRPRSRAEARR